MKKHGDAIQINHALLPALIEEHFDKQIDFARALGIPVSTLSSYIFGKRRPKAEMVGRMCELLHIDEEMLVTPTDMIFYQGQVIAMLRWSLSQARGVGEIPTHSEADMIARRLEAAAQVDEDTQDDTVREEDTPF